MPADEMGNQRLPQSPEVPTRIVLLTVAGALVFVALSMGALMLYFRWLVPGPLQKATRPYPEPTLQISPQGDLDRFKQEQRADLSGSAGHDPLRLPIEDAMRIVTARGQRAFDALDGPGITPPPGSRGGARP